jgi:hypothetical protein
LRTEKEEQEIPEEEDEMGNEKEIEKKGRIG